jgi:hypothetical protein
MQTRKGLVQPAWPESIRLYNAIGRMEVYLAGVLGPNTTHGLMPTAGSISLIQALKRRKLDLNLESG